MKRSPESLQPFLPDLTPDTMSPKITEDKPTERETPYYTLDEGTTIYTGPLGGNCEALGVVPEQLLARPMDKRVIGGIISHFVEVESPPENQVKRFWITQRSGNVTGFI